ncbi:MAG: hypothetical protein HOW97_16130 [Catenulispora sp.]|nr:hypothetical protein [Catenulispora sp.]
MRRIPLILGLSAALFGAGLAVAATGGAATRPAASAEAAVRASSVEGTDDLRYFGFARTYEDLPVVVTDAAGNLRGTTSAHSGALSTAPSTAAVGTAESPFSPAPGSRA